MIFKSKAVIVLLGIGLLFNPLLFAGWEAQNSGTTATLRSVHFPIGTDIGYVVGTAGTILKTTNGGTDWTPLTSGTNAPLNSVFFTDNQTGFVVGNGGIALKTTNGGGEWQTMNVGTNADLVTVQFLGNGVGYIATAGVNVLKSTDWGETWVSHSIPVPTANIRALLFPTEQVGFVVGLNGIFVRTLDGGENFELRPVGTNKNLYALAFPMGDPATGYILGDQVCLMTVDSGGTWFQMPAPPYTIYSACIPVNMAAAYAAGSEGAILKNSGSPTWSLQPSGVTFTLYSVFFPGQNDTGYVVGDSGTILKTVNGGIAGLAEGRIGRIKESLIKVCANPSQQTIALESRANTILRVFDASGRLLGSFPLQKGRNILPVIRPGVYIISAGSDRVKVVVSD